MTLTASARDATADYLKAAAIVAVVFIHTPGRGAGSVDEVLRFCVPVFVALWAYYFELGLARRPAEKHLPYARDKFVRLLIPYLFWTAVYLPMRHPPADWPTTPWQVHLDWWTGGGWPGQYFFIVLFQLIPFVLLTRRWAGPWVVWALVAAGPVGYLIAELAFLHDPALRWGGERLFVHWLPYAALGVGLARGYIPSLPAIPLVVVAAVALSLTPVEVRAMEAARPDPPRTVLVSAYVGSLGLLLALGPRPSEHARTPGAGGWIDAVVGYVGRNTYPVFVLHVLVLTPAGMALADILKTPGAVGAAARGALAVGVVAACLGLAWVI